ASPSLDVEKETLPQQQQQQQQQHKHTNCQPREQVFAHFQHFEMQTLNILRHVTTVLLLLLLAPLVPATHPRLLLPSAQLPSSSSTISRTKDHHDTADSLSTVYSTRMINSIITRQQGLVSSGQSTSTLESGMISLAIQAWLDLYAPSSSSWPSPLTTNSNRTKTLRDATASTAEKAIAFRDYVGAILDGITATDGFTNVTDSESLPLDRLTVAQAIQSLKDTDSASSTSGHVVPSQSHQKGPENSDNSGSNNNRTDPAPTYQVTLQESLALDVLNLSLAIQERNQYGGFWYYVYPSWSYLDGTVSFLPFMSATPTHWSPTDALLQIQLLYAHCQDLTNPTTPRSGLLVHGYDASRTAVWANNSTGGSPYVWGRSLGWYLTGLVNAWEVLTTTVDEHGQVPPSSNDGKGRGGTRRVVADHCRGQPDCADLVATIQTQFTTLVVNLARYADRDTGAFWQLPTLPGRPGNHLESSSTALFSFAILKGIRLGLVGDEEVPTTASSSSSSAGWKDGSNKTTTKPSSSSPFIFSSPKRMNDSNGTTSPPPPPSPPVTTTTTLKQIALRAYTYATHNFVIDYGNGTLGYNGTVTVCSLNSTASYEYYVSQPVILNAPLGEAAFVLASLEMERLGDRKIVG
ncbi:family 105 glycoside hydrolase, partial [Cryphonectria parasitica EP155]